MRTLDSMDAQKSSATMANEAAAAAATEQQPARGDAVWVHACRWWLSWVRVGAVARHGHNYGHGCPVMLAGDGSKKRLEVQQITGGGAETDEAVCE